jgi:hypothetical protein
MGLGRTPRGSASGKGWWNEQEAEKGQEEEPSDLRLEGSFPKAFETAKTHCASFGLG